MFADIDDDALFALATSEENQNDAAHTAKTKEEEKTKTSPENAATLQVVVQTKELEPVVQYIIKPVDVSVQPPLMPASSPLERKNRFLGLLYTWMLFTSFAVNISRVQCGSGLSDFCESRRC